MAALMVLRDLDRDHISGLRKMGFQVCFSGLKGDVPHIDFGVHFFLPVGWNQLGKENPRTEETPEDDPSPQGLKSGVPNS
jgi:hypothetical protein